MNQQDEKDEEPSVKASAHQRLQEAFDKLLEDNRRLRALVAHLQGGIRFLSTAAEVLSKEYGE